MDVLVYFDPTQTNCRKLNVLLFIYEIYLSIQFFFFYNSEQISLTRPHKLVDLKFTFLRRKQSQVLNKKKTSPGYELKYVLSKEAGRLTLPSTTKWIEC